MESDAFFTDFIESERHPGQHVNGVADEDEVAGEGIAGCVVLFPGEGWFEDEGVWCERLSSEDRAIVGDRGFKALRVDALRWVFAAVSTFLFLSDAGDVAECVSESASEDVGFIGWHPQWFLDGIRESVLGEFEVLEHGRNSEPHCVLFAKGWQQSLRDIFSLRLCVRRGKNFKREPF